MGKAAIDDLIATTEARASDFDPRRDVPLLDVLQEHGKADEAIKTLSQSLKHKNRDEIKNWRAYIHTILRKIDTEAYTVHKTTSGNFKGKTVSLEKNLDAPHTFNTDALEFKPGESSHVVAAEKKEAEAKPEEKGKNGKVEVPESKPKTKTKNGDDSEPGFLECCFRRSDE